MISWGDICPAFFFPVRDGNNVNGSKFQRRLLNCICLCQYLLLSLTDTFFITVKSRKNTNCEENKAMAMHWTVLNVPTTEARWAAISYQRIHTSRDLQHSFCYAGKCVGSVISFSCCILFHLGDTHSTEAAFTNTNKHTLPALCWYRFLLGPLFSHFIPGNITSTTQSKEQFVGRGRGGCTS